MFGLSYHLDCYGCKGDLDSLEVGYRFLEQLVEFIDMKAFSPPLVFHAPRVGGIELYPDKAGITGFIALITSSITIHTIVPEKFLTLDVYSCKDFNTDKVLEFTRKFYEFQNEHQQTLYRGKDY